MERSVIDWDESVYLLVSSSLVDGHLPYVEVWDHKQPFLYVLFAASFLAADPIVGMRLLGCVAVAVTAVLLAGVIRRVFRGWFAPSVAAGLYVLATMSSGGLATNTEIIFAPFVVAACALLVFVPIDDLSTREHHGMRFAAGGLICGLAIQVKLIAAFEVVAIVGAATVLWWPTRWPFRRAALLTMRRLLFFGLGALVPAVIAAGAYWLGGRFDEYVFANFVFNFAYSSADVDTVGLARAAVSRQLNQGNMLLWILGLFAVPLALWWVRFDRHTLRLVVAGIGWLTAALAAVFATGKFYDHHFIQVLPPLVFLVTAVIVTTLQRPHAITKALAVIMLVATVLVQATRSGRVLNREIELADDPRAVGLYLAGHVNAGEVIYVANAQPIVYVLSGAKSPSRFVLPTWVIRPEIRDRLGLDLIGFLNQVFRQRPSYVVMELDNPWLPDRGFVELLSSQYLDGEYEPEARFGSTLVFRRIQD